jgi:hypothetical protein
MVQNVMVPRFLLDGIIDLIEMSEIENHDDYDVRSKCYYLLEYLIWKQQKTNIRDSYSKLIQAGTQGAVDEARKLYLQQRQLNELDKEDMPF